MKLGIESAFISADSGLNDQDYTWELINFATILSKKFGKSIFATEKTAKFLGEYNIKVIEIDSASLSGKEFGFLIFYSDIEIQEVIGQLQIAEFTQSVTRNDFRKVVDNLRRKTSPSKKVEVGFKNGITL